VYLVTKASWATLLAVRLMPPPNDAVFKNVPVRKSEPEESSEMAAGARLFTFTLGVTRVAVTQENSPVSASSLASQ
jgi:hypothetical protein